MPDKPAVPMGMPGMLPGQMPGMMPQQNPMMMMMQMMQMMMQGGMGGANLQVDPASLPFTSGPVPDDDDGGLDSDIIRPATFTELIRSQEAVPTGTVLDYLCLSEDGSHSLGGIPKGCTIALAGPPGKGKTRTALTALSRIAQGGTKVALIVAEEGFHDGTKSGRDDLCSRLTKIGMKATGLDEATFKKQVLENLYVMEAQYHKGQSWDDFVGRYRYLVEKAQIQFVVIDSLNTLDPSRSHTADNLAALKTYNHERGITCLCIGQIRDTGAPVGGEQLQHTADAVFLIEETGLASKEMAEFWGGRYRDRIETVSAVKCVTTPTFPYPIRVAQNPDTGELRVHESQPAEYAVRPLA
jgi:KaiC/GvpD/RAD55 family RecA-like ATPase